MGETKLFQPLTREDRVTVVLYRTGIVLASLIVAVIAYMAVDSGLYRDVTFSLKANVVLVALYASVGMSVFFIHLYVSKFHTALKRLYYISLVALGLLFVLGKGDATAVLLHKSCGPLLLIPLSCCLGFITSKEAFCFRLTEGYLLTLIMPIYLLLVSSGGLVLRGVSYGIALIAVLLLFFTIRKVFMPIHYDIGDKAAYLMERGLKCPNSKA